MTEKTVTLNAVGNQTPSEIALCVLDRDIPVTPSGGNMNYQYCLTEADFRRMADTLVGKPVRMAMPAMGHYNSDGTIGDAIGSVVGWSVAENPEGLPEGKYAIVNTVLWEEDKPLEVSILKDDKEGEWGASWEVSLVKEPPEWTVVSEGGLERIYIGSEDNPSVFEGLAVLPRTFAAYNRYTKVLSEKEPLDFVPDDMLPDEVRQASEEDKEAFKLVFNQTFTAPLDESFTDLGAELKHRTAVAAAAGLKAMSLASGSREDARKAQEKRSRKYGIEILENNSNLTIPARYRRAGAVEDDFADRVNYKFVVWLTKSPDTITEAQLNQVRNAAARFAQFGDVYKPESRKIVYGRIVQALKKFGIGQYRSEAAESLPGAGETDEVVRTSAVEEGSPIETGGERMNDEELQTKLDELQGQLQSVSDSLASALNAQGSDTVSDYVETVKETRALLSEVLPEEKKELSLKEAAEAIVAEVKEAREAARKAEIQQRADAHFAEIKDRYPDDVHEEVKAACYNIAASLDVDEAFKKLFELLPKVSAEVGDGPPRADGEDVSGPRYKDPKSGEKVTMAELMLRAVGKD